MTPAKSLPNEALIFKPDCKLLSCFQGLIDPSNSVDSYAFYSTMHLIYIHSAGIDCDEVIEVIVEGDADEYGNFRPDQVFTKTESVAVYPPMQFFEELVAYALRMLVGSDEMQLDREAFRNAKKWIHPSLCKARPVLKERHGKKTMF